MTERERSVQAEGRGKSQGTIAPLEELRRAFGGFTRWGLLLFIGLVALREISHASWWPLRLSIPVWLVFVPLALVVVIRPVRADGAAPRTLSPPVSGRWTAINSPATKVPSHGVRSLGQAFAIDIVRTSERETPPKIGWGLRQAPAEEFSSFGEVVRAAEGGTVVGVHGRRRDHRARSTWPGVVFMLTIEALCREIGGPRFILGNHVVIEHADGSYAAYAHLRQGSLTVGPGTSVNTGQPIGTVGNSGNSSEPHLHFQLMDRPQPSRAAGLPFRWRDITIEPVPDPRWTTSTESQSSRELQSIVEGLPGTGQVFRATRPA